MGFSVSSFHQTSQFSMTTNIDTSESNAHSPIPPAPHITADQARDISNNIYKAVNERNCLGIFGGTDEKAIWDALDNKKLTLNETDYKMIRNSWWTDHKDKGDLDLELLSELGDKYDDYYRMHAILSGFGRADSYKSDYDKNNPQNEALSIDVALLETV